MKQIAVVEDVLKRNDEIAALNRETFRGAGILALDLIGAPGCGKTALLEATLRQLRGRIETGVLVGDLATSRDGDRLRRWADQVAQINTGMGCHLDANQVRQALGRLDLSRLDLLVIENVGNLVCPVGFDLGQDHKVGMFSVSEGDDKAAKHPYLVREAELLLLNKMDLLPHVPFRLEVFEQDVRRLNESAPLLRVCAARGEIDPWIDWLEARLGSSHNKPQRGDTA